MARTGEPGTARLSSPEDSFSGLLGQLNPVLLTLPASPGSAAETFSAAYAKTVSGDQDLLPLAGMANAVFERNLPLLPTRAEGAGQVARIGNQTGGRVFLFVQTAYSK
jgi:hypothetical protein